MTALPARAPSTRRDETAGWVRLQALLTMFVLVVGAGTAIAREPATHTLSLVELQGVGDALADHKTARLSMKITIDVGDESRTVETEEGATDFISGRSRLVFDFSGLGGGAWDEAAPPVEMITDRKHFYMRPPLGSGFTGVTGKPWLRAPAPRGTGTGDLAGDPLLTVDQLRLAAGAVRSRGGELVRGLPTRRYSGRIPLVAMLEQVPADKRDLVELTFERAAIDGMDVDVWVDGQGVPRRVQMRMQIAGGSFTIRMEMFDFGADVRIDLPPLSETTTLDTVEELNRMIQSSVQAG